jgi:hypothetical protein
MTFLATQHWLHGFILFILLGGSASDMMNMSMGHMVGFQQMMMVHTLGTVLWSVYKLIQDGFKNKSMIVMTSISSVISVGYVIVAWLKTGW